MPRLRLLIAGLDGLQPSQVNATLTPTIHRLATQGMTFARHHAVFPTVTRVNAASLVTGCYPGSHGLLGNTLIVPEWQPHRPMPALEPELRRLAEATGRVLLAPTLGELLSDCGLSFGTVVGGTSGNAYVQHPRAAQTRGTVLHAEFALPPEHYAPMVARFGVWPPKRAPELGRIRQVADVFLGYLLPQVDPDVALVWFPEPDTSQHAAGVGSPPACEALAAADTELDRILNELRRRGAEPDVLVVSDHGYSTVARRIPIAEVLREAGFPPCDEPEGVAIAPNGGAVLFYVRDSDPATLERLVGWLVRQPWAGALVAGRPAGESLGLLPGELLGVGGPRAPDVVLSFRWDSSANANGFRGHSDSAEWAPGLGTHGSGSPHEVRCTLIATGPSFRSGGVSELPSGNIDVAPTILRVLKIPPGVVFDGRPLTEGLRDGAEAAPGPSTPDQIEATTRIGGVTLRCRAVIERVGRTRYVASLSGESS